MSKRNFIKISFCFVFLFASVWTFVHPKNIFAQQYNCANGGAAACTNAGGTCSGADCLLDCVTCNRIGAVCGTGGTCTFVYRYSGFVAGPVCSPDCAGQMGTNLENIGIVCMQPECNGCDDCNPNKFNEHLAILRNNKATGEVNVNQNVHNVDEAFISDFFGLVTGDSNDKGEPVFGPSAISGISRMMASMYKNPPASGAEYLADLGTSFGLARPAYAQGVGFTAMQQILPAWKAARNVAYIFFIIAFIVSGFAIMFRMKISPQTVISIQNALPKMIITLILVTFSYAIAGFLIDLSYLFLYLAVLAFGQTGWLDTGLQTTAGWQTKLTNLNFWGGWGMIYGGAVKAMFSSVGAMFDSLTTGGPVIGGFLGGALAAILGVLGALVFWLVALVLMFKLFFALVACYVQVVLLIFIGPILIAFDALPNGKNGFKSWLNKLMGNIMVFPGVAFMLMIGNIMSSKVNISAWSPPLFGDRHDLVGPIFAFGVLMMAAKMPEIIKGMFKLKDEGYGSAIGQAVMGGTSMIRKPIAGKMVDAANEDVRLHGASLSAAALRALGQSLGR